MMNVNSITIGQRLRFMLLSPHDTSYHQGTVVSLCDYDSAKRYSDIDVEYSMLTKSGKEVEHKEADIYVVLKYTSIDGVSQLTAYGRSWIDPATLEVVDENTYYDIRVYDIAESVAQDVVKSIEAMGYAASLIKK